MGDIIDLAAHRARAQDALKLAEETAGVAAQLRYHARRQLHLNALMVELDRNQGAWEEASALLALRTRPRKAVIQ